MMNDFISLGQSVVRYVMLNQNVMVIEFILQLILSKQQDIEATGYRILLFVDPVSHDNPFSKSV